MKHIILLKLLNMLSSGQHLKKKLKKIAIIGLIIVVATSGLAIWAGVSAISLINDNIRLVNVQNKFHDFKSEIGSLSAVATLDCWSKTQNLMSLEFWMQRALTDNLKELKAACLDERPSSICEGDSCNKLKKQMNTAKGDHII